MEANLRRCQNNFWPETSRSKLGQTAQLPESIPPSTFASYNSQYERSQLYQTESPIYPPKTTKKMRAPSTVGHYNAQKAESSTTQLLIENTCVCPMPTR